MPTTIGQHPPVELSLEEQRIARVSKRTGELYGFLREVRHNLQTVARLRKAARERRGAPIDVCGPFTCSAL